jgi:hypothetical protein
MFWENFHQKFFKHMWHAPFLATQPNKLWQLNGDHIFLSCPSLWVIETSKTGFVIFPLFQAPFDGNN